MRWVFLILSILPTMEQRLDYQPTQNVTAASSYPVDPSVQWSDQSAEDYKDALLEAFRAQREER